MSKLLMLKGLPASGKSTYAKKIASSGYVRVNKDDMRAMLNDGKWSKSNEKEVIKIRDYIISESLYNGKSVVVDDTNFAPVHRDRLQELAKKYGATFETKFFDTPLQECIKRDTIRANGVGKDVIMQMYNQYLKPRPEVYTPPKNKPKAVLVDIDGTLTKMADRSPYDWSRVKEDGVNRPVLELVRELSNSYTIIIMSGRDSICREDTIEWLNEKGVFYAELFMRPEGDTRKDDIVKRELFENNIRDNYQVQFVLDDRNQVVDMWRSIGLTCLQVAEGDF